MSIKYRNDIANVMKSREIFSAFTDFDKFKFIQSFWYGWF